jgi:hypothetical protein
MRPANLLDRDAVSHVRHTLQQPERKHACFPKTRGLAGLPNRRIRWAMSYSGEPPNRPGPAHHPVADRRRSWRFARRLARRRHRCAHTETLRGGSILWIGLAFGLSVGVASGITVTSWLWRQVMVTARWLRDLAALRLMHLLEGAHRRGVLRQAGVGHQFHPAGPGGSEPANVSIRPIAKTPSHAGLQRSGVRIGLVSRPLNHHMNVALSHCCQAAEM